MGTAEFQDKMRIFTDNLDGKFNNASADVTNSLNNINPTKLLSLELEDEDFMAEYNRKTDSEALPHVEDENKLYHGDNTYMGIELGLPCNDHGALQHTVVKRRAVDIDGKPIGTPHDKTIYDHRQYEVEFLNSDTEVLLANIIAENLLAQVDAEGH